MRAISPPVLDSRSSDSVYSHCRESRKHRHTGSPPRRDSGPMQQVLPVKNVQMKESIAIQYKLLPVETVLHVQSEKYITSEQSPQA